MSALAGKGSSLKIGANTVVGINDVSLTINGDEIDVTTFSSNGWKEFIQGLKSGKVTAKGLYEPTDTNGQVALRTAWLNGTTVANVQVMVDATHGFSASVLTTGMDIGTTPEGEVAVTFNLTVTGAVSVVG